MLLARGIKVLGSQEGLPNGTKAWEFPKEDYLQPFENVEQIGEPE